METELFKQEFEAPHLPIGPGQTRPAEICRHPSGVRYAGLPVVCRKDAGHEGPHEAEKMSWEGAAR